MELSAQIEALLFYRNEPVTVKEIARLLQVGVEEVGAGLTTLSEKLVGRGIALIQNGDEAVLAASKDASELLLSLRKDELSRDLGKAGAETLAIVLYRAPVRRSEIDFIRGVNSSFILRNLLVRGLVEKTNDSGRSVRYQPTAELLAHLGLTSVSSMPNFERVTRELMEFEKQKQQQEPAE